MQHQELELEKRCRQYARTHGWVAAKLEKNGNKGIPDDLFISPDERCYLVEFKKDERQQARREQERWLQRFPTIARKIGTFESFCDFLGLPSDTSNGAGF